ncbi:MAG TPA: TetR family transcriptional regulator [Noviherbaspirillum sp.]|nr:TetR family transcriptional regulator [Noviherbaspirillum sp.]
MEPVYRSMRKSERTRAAILRAARTLFAENGYVGTTLRDVASSAGVDPALVIRYFGNKEILFIRASELKLELPSLIMLDKEKIGEALVRHFLQIWEGVNSSDSMLILLRSATTNEASAEKVRQIFAMQVLPALNQYSDLATTPMRAGLIASQLLGLALCKYLLQIPSLVNMNEEDIVRLVGPTIQRYVECS